MQCTRWWKGEGSVTYYDQSNFDFFMTYFCNLLVPFSFSYDSFASLAFVSLLISRFSLWSETSDFAQFSHRFASTENERRTLFILLLLRELHALIPSTSGSKESGSKELCRILFCFNYWFWSVNNVSVI
jgi:hypothetical protein